MQESIQYYRFLSIVENITHCQHKWKKHVTWTDKYCLPLLDFQWQPSGLLNLGRANRRWHEMRSRVKVKIWPRRDHEGQEGEQRYISWCPTRKETSSEACQGRARFQQHRDASCHQVSFPARQGAEGNSRHSDRNINCQNF
jgi:hypothetical protein